MKVLITLVRAIVFTPYIGRHIRHLSEKAPAKRPERHEPLSGVSDACLIFE